MRRIFQVLIVFLSLLTVSGFMPFQQTDAGKIVVLNRAGQATSHITDGDTIKIQITLLQPATQQTEITIKLGGSVPLGSCAIPSGGTTCLTTPFYALGWYWEHNGVVQSSRFVQAFVNNAESIGQSEPIMISPRPVVMVHGFISNSDTWISYLGSNGYLSSIGVQGFAVGDGQVPGKLNTGIITDPTARTNTIAQNAEALQQYISGVKQKTGAEMVDLVVHSMGGMISRYYIDRVMQDRDVAQLIMLGSPMGGSDCAVLPAALGFFLPASIEIRQSYMTRIFNSQITRRRNIEFYDLGGTAINDAFKSPCTDVPNDMVVSLGSVNAVTLQSSTLDSIHSNLTFSDQAFQDFVKPLLEKPAGTFLSTPDPGAITQAESPLEFTRVYTGHVASGGLTDLTINIEAGLSVASFALYDASRSITTVVRGANGNIIELNPDTNGFIKVDDPSALFYLGYGFKNPKPGPWKITVQATAATPSTGTNFAISVYFVGGAKLSVTSNTLVPQINDQVRFDASLSLNGQPLEIKEAKAVIKDSDGKVETLNFPAGQKISTTWTPQNSGTYAVDIVVTGAAPDGSPFERTNFLAIEVQPGFSKSRVTFNLIALIVIILLALFLVMRFIFRGTGKLIRKVRN